MIDKELGRERLRGEQQPILREDRLGQLQRLLVPLEYVHHYELEEGITAADKIEDRYAVRPRGRKQGESERHRHRHRHRHRPGNR
jgi:hypothetical protein